MSTLKLVTTETFNNLSCSFYRNMNDDILLTREQIGQALEYADPSMCIRRIHLKHKDRLDPLCIRMKLGQYQIGTNLTKSEEQERVYYTERGVMEICRWSRQPKANLFMDWVWDIVEKYRHNDLVSMNDFTQVANAVSSLTTTVSDLAKAMTDITTTITAMQNEINNLKTTQKVISQRKYSYWSTKMFPKYQLLAEYFDISYTELYKNLYREMQNLYPDIDLNQLKEDYCYENKLETCYTLDAIEHSPHIRVLFENVVDTLLRQYDLMQPETTQTKYTTIFDKAS
jgi:prophage antirepressor-like protein